MRRCLPALTAVIMLAVPAAAHAAEGDIIVQRAPGLDNSERAELRKDAGVTLVDTLPLEHTELVEPTRGRDLVRALAALRADRHVVFAEIDQPVRLNVSSGFDWSSLWSLTNETDNDIDAPEAWTKSEGSGVTVAVVDTGINSSHVDLKNQITGDAAELNGVPGEDDDGNGYRDDFRGWDFVGKDNFPEDDNGHGSHVSGTIAAEAANNTGVVGVAPRAKVMPLRALKSDGSGYMSDVAAAFDYAGDLGVRIVNSSIGGDYSEAVERVIAAHPNTLYVAAAGNDHTTADKEFPCALPGANVVCVGASDGNDQRASFSNYGAAVDLFAPGDNIRSAYKDGSSAYVTLDGTSMAAPHVAGAAAAALALRPGASLAFLRWSVLSSVDAEPALNGLSVSGGRLNENGTVNAILGEDPTATPPAATPTPPPAATPAPVPPVATPAPPPVVVPAITALKVRGSLRTKTSKLKVSSTLTAATTVKFTVKRRGSKATFADWSRSGRTGANSVTLTRKLPTKRTLKRGTYTLTASAGASAKSATIRVP